eukprot:scaffold219823_cov36-Cyclotella_meneghiniana.AAC.1
MSTIKTVMVTGANGYLGSHIVKILLSKGYTVHACVRNASNTASVSHLLHLAATDENKLHLFSTGDMGDPSLKGRYDEPLKECDAIIHSSTPISPMLSGKDFDGERDILNPGMEGTHELLDSILECETRPSIQCLVLTSSMSAAAPTPEPSVKDESHWSDDAGQLTRGNYYGCLKTRQEKLCHEWATSQKGRTLSDNFRFVAILPTMITGAPVGYDQAGFSYTPSGTMGYLHSWLTIGKPNAPNDSMSFIDVQDCAAMHVAALRRRITLKELYGGLPPFALYEGEKCVPTQFNLSRMNSLGVDVKDVCTILKDCVSFFREVGALK